MQKNELKLKTKENNYGYSSLGRTTNKDGTLTIRYKVKLGTYFNIDGDLKRTLEVNGNLNYVLHCLRDKLRKFENGQIKVVKYSSKEKDHTARDWEQEEKIKKHL